MTEQLSLLDEGARPTWGPLDQHTADVVDLVGNDPRRDEDYEAFLHACRMSRIDGQVSINDVRSYMSNDHGLTIEPRRYSAFWRRACKDGHLRKTGRYDINDDHKGKNAGRPQRLYVWVGAL